MSIKKILIVFMLIMVVFANTQVLFATGGLLGGGNTTDKPKDPYIPGVVPGNVENIAKNIWATASVVIQIVSVACVVFAGLRYMFASADQKADIKQGLIYLAIGAVLVFGATSIINLVVNATNEIL